jgi:mannose-1-phosphate guanylyltransferase
MQAMILAAGFGTRLRPYSLIRPKPLFPVCNRALLQIMVEQLRDAGFHKITVNTHHLSDQIAAFCSGYSGITLQKETEILGTGGALRKAMPIFDAQPLLVINGDIVHDLDLKKLYTRHVESGAAVSMVVHHYPRFSSLSIDSEFKVAGIGEERPTGSAFRQMAFTGIHFIDPALLKLIPANCFFNIIDLYKECIRSGNGPKALIEDQHYWRDIGTVADYLAVHDDLIRNPEVFSSNLPISFQKRLLKGDASISADAKIVDWAVVGDGAVIDEHVVLERSVVWDGVHVAKNSHLIDTIAAGL